MPRGRDGNHLGQHIHHVEHAESPQGGHPILKQIHGKNRLGNNELCPRQRLVKGSQSVRIGIGIGMPGGRNHEVFRKDTLDQHLPRQLAHADRIEGEDGRPALVGRQVAGQQECGADADVGQMDQPLADLIRLPIPRHDVGDQPCGVDPQARQQLGGHRIVQCIGPPCPIVDRNEIDFAGTDQVGICLQLAY